MIDKYDHEERRCPMLGHEIHFKYCREVNNSKPCRKVFDCWFEQIPVQKHIADFYTVDDINKILEPPKPKVLSLFELIEQAKASIK